MSNKYQNGVKNHMIAAVLDLYIEGIILQMSDEELVDRLLGISGILADNVYNYDPYDDFTYEQDMELEEKWKVFESIITEQVKAVERSNAAVRRPDRSGTYDIF